MKTNFILYFVSFITVLTLFSFVDLDNQSSSGPFVVVLDAGHGGKDPGNLGNGYREKKRRYNAQYRYFLYSEIKRLC